MKGRNTIRPDHGDPVEQHIDQRGQDRADQQTQWPRDRLPVAKAELPFRNQKNQIPKLPQLPEPEIHQAILGTVINMIRRFIIQAVR